LHSWLRYCRPLLLIYNPFQARNRYFSCSVRQFLFRFLSVRFLLSANISFFHLATIDEIADQMEVPYNTWVKDSYRLIAIHRNKVTCYDLNFYDLF
jgi:hypothetical protein